MGRAVIFLCGLFMLVGCAGTSLDNRAGLLEHAAGQGFQLVDTGSAKHPLALLRKGSPQHPMLVVIEGDGLAFINRYTPSPDPTPLTPDGFLLANRLANALPDHAVAYMARPCQYLSAAELAKCPSNLWLLDRFGAEAQNRLKQSLNALSARPTILIGISGGGVIAAHLATETNTRLLITLAAPLALNEWARHHQVSTFLPTDDPLEKAPLLTGTPQLHIAGQNDKTVPAHVIQRFAHQAQGTFIEVEGARHSTIGPAAIPYILQAINW